MRLDPEHVRRLRQAIDADGNIKICPDKMRRLQALPLWAHGAAMQAITKAAAAVAGSKRLRLEQRVLLELVIPDSIEIDEPASDTPEEGPHATL